MQVELADDRAYTLGVVHGEEAQLGPVVNEVSIRVDGVRLGEIFLDELHDVGHLQLGLVRLEADVSGRGAGRGAAQLASFARRLVGYFTGHLRVLRVPVGAVGQVQGRKRFRQALRPRRRRGRVLFPLPFLGLLRLAVLAPPLSLLRVLRMLGVLGVLRGLRVLRVLGSHLSRRGRHGYGKPHRVEGRRSPTLPNRTSDRPARRPSALRPSPSPVQTPLGPTMTGAFSIKREQSTFLEILGKKYFFW